MPRYIALLRGINVSGQKIIKMVDLKAMFEAANCTSVVTYIQSGNVVFEHAESDSAQLRQHLEVHLKASLGYAVPTLLRTHAALAAIVSKNPFDDQLPEFGKRMYVCFLENAPDTTAIAAIAPYTNPEEQLQVHGSEAFVYYAGGLGKAKLTNAIIERRLGMATMRNWNTVNTLLEMSKPN
ncbi:MAG: DUF1697 domain-containing protein [Bacteroidia bacterium]|nr:DUF1697 domain-containing protein [Bacteroidia bacterium]